MKALDKLLATCVFRAHRHGAVEKNEATSETAAGGGRFQAKSTFRTDHLLVDLTRRSVRGGGVTIGAQGIKFILQMGSTMVLARLLTPEDFGLVAMVTALTGFVAMFKDAGLSAATIQRAEITHEQISLLFWVNVLLSLFATVIAVLFAPLAAWICHDGRLVMVTYAFASTFIFGGLTVQHQALLTRQMQFKLLAIIDIISMVFGVIVGIVMAYLKCGYWALVGVSTCTAIVNCALVWLAFAWRPSWPRRGIGAGQMLAFGANLSGFNFLNYFTRNADNVIIGSSLGAISLGLYSRAYSLLMLPVRQINGPINSVTVPALSALQGDDAAYRKYFINALSAMTAISLPIVVFMLIEAQCTVRLVLGPQWADVTKIFIALGPAAIMGTFNVAPGWLFISRDRTRILFWYGLVSAPVTVIAFFIGLNWGVLGVAWAFSMAFCSCYLVIVPISCKDTPVGPLDYLTAMWFPALATVASGFLVLVVRSHLGGASDWLRFSIGFVVFSLSYICLWIVVPNKRKSAFEIVQVFARSR